MLYINLILKYWKELALGLLLIAMTALYVRLGMVEAQKETLVAEKKTLEVHLNDCQNDVKKLSAAIQSQNIAIEQLKQAADERARRAAGEINRANAVASGFKKMADGLLNTPPDPKLSSCENANVLINKEITRAVK